MQMTRICHSNSIGVNAMKAIIDGMIVLPDAIVG